MHNCDNPNFQHNLSFWTESWNEVSLVFNLIFFLIFEMFLRFCSLCSHLYHLCLGLVQLVTVHPARMVPPVLTVTLALNASVLMVLKDSLVRLSQVTTAMLTLYLYLCNCAICIILSITFPVTTLIQIIL